MKLWILTLAVAVTASACGLPDDSAKGPAGPDLTLQVAQTRAVELGRQLTPQIASVQTAIDTGIEAGLTPAEAIAQALTGVFGPEVGKELLGDGEVRFGNAFSIRPGDTEGNPGAVPSIDGRPSLLIWSLTGDNGFFYEPTVWDMRTGDLYQGIMGTGFDAETWRFFGPLSPSLDARVTGIFDDAERRELYNSIREGLFDVDAGAE